jgi:LPS sulfotransferase NodH/2-polyprenyl-3-methyl-5-hydroxy-6-metoxy-1,4-benzoquinol methylase
MANLQPIRFVTDERLDFNHNVRLRKSYMIASSYRCGSQYLCWQLWQTGVLGAPCEYLNPGYELRVLMKRFGVFSYSDYIAKLIERRTSKNGVFGMKEHYHHFDAFLKACPDLLEVLAPVSYIYINRRDKLAQSVSLAKALQTNWWSSRMEEGPKPPLEYNRDLIEKCLKEVEAQDTGWQQWFEARNIVPYHVTYEDLTADAGSVVRKIVELVGVENDAPERVNVPPAKKQSDETNEEWIVRFTRDGQASGRHQTGIKTGKDTPSPPARDESEAASGHFFDRYDWLIAKLPEGSNSATGFIDAMRLRRRYDAVIWRHRDLLQNSRVLDIMSGHGFWSLAALDAGAAHVCGVDPSQAFVEEAEKNLSTAGIGSDRGQFIKSNILAYLGASKPGEFDVILCVGFLEQSYIPQFFHELSRVKPKHVILDTGIAAGQGPMARYSITPGRGRAIMSTPTHDLLEFLCEPKFRCRAIDWQAMGVTDWTGVQDYARNTRRTYVFDLM